MAIRPDYGLRILRDGHDPRVALDFYNMPIDGFDVLAEGRYTLTIDRMYAGERHCISFDFGADILDAILSALPRCTEHFIRRDLVDDTHALKTFKIDRVFCNHLSALLGQVQTGRDYRFVPLVITRVSVEPGFRR